MPHEICSTNYEEINNLIGFCGAIGICLTNLNLPSNWHLVEQIIFCLTKWDLKLVRVSKRKAIAKLKNFNTRESVEMLRGKKIYLESINFPEIKENEFYIKDLINCEVFLQDKRILGIVKSIENYGAGDLINVKKDNGNEFLIPMNKQNVVLINLLKKKIVINPMKGIID